MQQIIGALLCLFTKRVELIHLSWKSHFKCFPLRCDAEFRKLSFRLLQGLQNTFLQPFLPNFIPFSVIFFLLFSLFCSYSHHHLPALLLQKVRRGNSHMLFPLWFCAFFICMFANVTEEKQMSCEFPLVPTPPRYILPSHLNKRNYILTERPGNKTFADVWSCVNCKNASLHCFHQKSLIRQSQQSTCRFFDFRLITCKIN